MILACYLQTGQYEKALVYLRKMLKLSWFINDQEAELKILDQIGFCFYSLG